jgi:hypothetical protein
MESSSPLNYRKKDSLTFSLQDMENGKHTHNSTLFAKTATVFAAESVSLKIKGNEVNTHTHSLVASEDEIS